jgi:hypothetical protein
MGNSRLIRESPLARLSPVSESQALSSVAAAFRKAGAPAVEGFRKVLLGIIAGEDDRRRFKRKQG